MRVKRSILLCCVGAVVLIGGCKKKSNNNVSGGGKGGNHVILVTPEHHNFFVDSCTIYLKYGTNDAPASGVYDDSAKCILSDTTPVATFKNLMSGLYYLYALGYHAGYVPPEVKGGLPCTINNEDTIRVYLPTYSY